LPRALTVGVLLAPNITFGDTSDMTTVETERLVLRPWVEEGLSLMLAATAHRDVGRPERYRKRRNANGSHHKPWRSHDSEARPRARRGDAVAYRCLPPILGHRARPAALHRVP